MFVNKLHLLLQRRYLSVLSAGNPAAEYHEQHKSDKFLHFKSFYIQIRI